MMAGMSDKLAEIEQRLQKVTSLAWAMGYYTETDDLDPQAQTDMQWLVAEIVRLRDFAKLVVDMRNAQKAYFRDRRPSDLTESKRLEKLVDQWPGIRKPGQNGSP